MSRKCSVASCRELAVSRGLCNHHLAQLKINISGAKNKGKQLCAVEGCKEKVFKQELCKWHLQKEKAKKNKACAVYGCKGYVFDEGLCKSHFDMLDSEIGKSERKKRGCIVEGCYQPHTAKGFCKTHYRQNRSGLIDDNGVFVTNPPKCSIEGCKNKLFNKNFCYKHYLEDKETSPDTTIEQCTVDGCTESAVIGGTGKCIKHHNEQVLHDRALSDRYTLPANKGESICTEVGCWNDRIKGGLKCKAHTPPAIKKTSPPQPAPKILKKTKSTTNKVVESSEETKMDKVRSNEVKLCIVGNCLDEAFDKNVCVRHYKALVQPIGKKGKCKLGGCDEPEYQANLCRKHFDLL